MTLRLGLAEKGIAVLELLLAISLLAAVVLSLGASSLYTSKVLERSRTELRASKFAQAELERLLALPYDSLVSGSRTLADGSSSWTVDDRASYREIILISHYAPASAISLWDTVATYRLAP